MNYTIMFSVWVLLGLTFFYEEKKKGKLKSAYEKLGYGFDENFFNILCAFTVAVFLPVIILMRVFKYLKS